MTEKRLCGLGRHSSLLIQGNMRAAALSVFLLLLVSICKAHCSFMRKSALVSVVGSADDNVGMPTLDPAKIALQIRYCGG